MGVLPTEGAAQAVLRRIRIARNRLEHQIEHVGKELLVRPGPVRPGPPGARDLIPCGRHETLELVNRQGWNASVHPCTTGKGSAAAAERRLRARRRRSEGNGALNGGAVINQDAARQHPRSAKQRPGHAAQALGMLREVAGEEGKECPDSRIGLLVLGTRRLR